MTILKFKRMYDFEESSVYVGLGQTPSVSEVKSVIKDQLGIKPWLFDIVQSGFIKDTDKTVDLGTLVEIIVHPENRELPYDLRTSLPDCMTFDTDEPTVKLSCGHAIAPDNLFSSCLSQLNDRKTSLHCPSCNRELTFLETIQKASLNQDEKSFFELRMNLNMAEKGKSCPKCLSFCERQDTSNPRVSCTHCMKKSKCAFEFCWDCGNTWASNHICPNVKRALQDQLNNCDRITVDCNNMSNVPSIRACPNCKYLIEHNTGCKTMTCTYCNTIFCFCCLKIAVNGKLPCGNYSVVCSVAPIQIV